MKPRYALLLFVLAHFVVGNGLQVAAQDTKGKVTKAPDPIVGTWKLNGTKSKLSPILEAALKQAAPKEGIESYREKENDQIEMTYTRKRADGSSTSEIVMWPAQGGAAKFLQGGIEGELYVETRIEPGNWYVTLLKSGKQFAVMHKTIAKDGKTMTQTITGTDAHGKPFEQVQVLDRQ